MEIIQQPEHKRILMIFEGATHIWREIYMDGRKFPKATSSIPRILAIRSVVGRTSTRWSSRTRASTRTAGSITSAIRTPTRWKSSSGGRAEQADAALRGDGHRFRCTPDRSRWRGHSGVKPASCLSNLPGEQPVSQSSRGRFWQSDLRSSSAARTEEADDGNPLGE